MLKFSDTMSGTCELLSIDLNLLRRCIGKKDVFQPEGANSDTSELMEKTSCLI